MYQLPSAPRVSSFQRRTHQMREVFSRARISFPICFLPWHGIQARVLLQINKCSWWTHLEPRKTPTESQPMMRDAFQLRHFQAKTGSLWTPLETMLTSLTQRLLSSEATHQWKLVQRIATRRIGTPCSCPSLRLSLVLSPVFSKKKLPIVKNRVIGHYQLNLQKSTLVPPRNENATLERRLSRRWRFTLNLPKMMSLWVVVDDQIIILVSVLICLLATPSSQWSTWLVDGRRTQSRLRLRPTWQALTLALLLQATSVTVKR